MQSFILSMLSTGKSFSAWKFYSNFHDTHFLIVLYLSGFTQATLHAKSGAFFQAIKEVIFYKLNFLICINLSSKNLKLFS